MADNSPVEMGGSPSQAPEKQSNVVSFADFRRRRFLEEMGKHPHSQRVLPVDQATDVVKAVEGKLLGDYQTLVAQGVTASVIKGVEKANRSGVLTKTGSRIQQFGKSITISPKANPVKE